MKSLLLCLLVASASNCVLSARILAVLPCPLKSHHYILQAVLKTLAAEGHQIVNYSPHPLEEPVANYRDVPIRNYDMVEKHMSLEMWETILNASPICSVKFIWAFSMEILKSLFNDEGVKKLIASDEKFDLVIVEAMFGQEAVVSFGHRFKAPVVNIHTFGHFGAVSRVAGNDLSLSYIPDFGFSSSDHMSFTERALSAYSVLSSLQFFYSEYLPSQEAYMNSVFQDPTMPSLVDMLHNISLFVNNVNSHVHYSQPYTPNIIPIGGIHLSPDRKPLPTDVKTFLDGATEGVIVLSLGSILPDNILPQKFFDNFINTFRRLPYKVLWKTKRSLEGVSDKVLISKWMPQQDVLAHPNVVLFITHGGLLSQHEAINAGVPVICIPFLGDQPMNAKFYEAREVGVKLNFKDLSEETIHSAITTVLNSPKYKNNMAMLSRIYWDQPKSPAENVVFWVEYVLRHGGAQHLRPASSLMPFYQLYLLDIIASVLVAATASLLVLFFIIRTIFRSIFCKKEKGDVPSSKKTKKD